MATFLRHYLSSDDLRRAESIDDVACCRAETRRSAEGYAHSSRCSDCEIACRLIRCSMARHKTRGRRGRRMAAARMFDQKVHLVAHLPLRGTLVGTTRLAL